MILSVIQGVDEHQESLGWTVEPMAGPYSILQEVSETYRALNIPIEDELNPEIQITQDEYFMNCEDELMVSVPSDKEDKLRPTEPALMPAEDRNQLKLCTLRTITARAKLSSPL